MIIHATLTVAVSGNELAAERRHSITHIDDRAKLQHRYKGLFVGRIDYWRGQDSLCLNAHLWGQNKFVRVSSPTLRPSSKAVTEGSAQ